MEPVDEPQTLWIDAARHPLGIRVHVRGRETLANTEAYWAAAVRYLRMTGAGKLLLVDELDGEGLEESEWRGLVEKMANFGLEQVRIAHVKPHGLRTVEYCERLSRAAGYEARLFTSEAEAERWLGDGGG
jgi:hypothetical protein